MNTKYLEKRLECAKIAALAAGQKILSHYNPHGTTLEIKQKSPTQPVTIADLEANETIKEALAAFLQTDGWLSEEDADNTERFAKEFVWIVDPLDGTRDFINGNPEFTVSIGLAQRGVPVLGVICNPVTHDLFWGAQGLGVWQNERPVRLTTGAAVPTIVVSRSEFGRGEWQNCSLRAKIVPCGGSANKLAQVAAGHADAALTFVQKSEWDICAGAALILAGGGKITDADGKPLAFNKTRPEFKSVFYASPVTHAQILAELSNAPTH